MHCGSALSERCTAAESSTTTAAPKQHIHGILNGNVYLFYFDNKARALFEAEIEPAREENDADDDDDDVDINLLSISFK